MDPKKPKRKSCSYRISPEVDAILRDFVRRQRGHPLYLELGAFVEEAIRRHLAHMHAQLDAVTAGGGHNHSGAMRSSMPDGIE